MTTGQRIKAARKSAGFTQKELGEKLEISYQTIAQWENNLRNPKVETLQRIADALGVPVSELRQLEVRPMAAQEAVMTPELDSYIRAQGYALSRDSANGVVCIEEKTGKRYALSNEDVAACRQALQTYTKFQMAELLKKGKLVSGGHCIRFDGEQLPLSQERPGNRLRVAQPPKSKK